MARTTTMLEFELAVLQSELRELGQLLNMTKCEVLTEGDEGDPATELEERAPPPRSWTQAELGAYERQEAPTLITQGRLRTALH